MKATVLVVDDENVTLRIVRHALASIDVEAVDAEDGQRAVQLASQSQFDMAIVDINLPDMDGFEVVRRLKSFDHLREVPIVMFTARHTRDDELLAAGGTGLDGGGTVDAGGLLLYRRDPSLDVWAFEAALAPPAPQPGERLGIAVAIAPDASRIFAGTYDDAAAGSVVEFRHDAGPGWDAGTRIRMDDRAPNDRFGRSVAVDPAGTDLVIGAYRAEENDAPRDAGSVRVLDLERERLALDPPAAGIAGEVNVWTVRDAAPGTLVVLLASRSAVRDATAWPGCPGVTLDLEAPLEALASATSDEEGTATLVAFVPAALQGRITVQQAVEPATCRIGPPAPVRWE